MCTNCTMVAHCSMAERDKASRVGCLNFKERYNPNAWMYKLDIQSGSGNEDTSLIARWERDMADCESYLTGTA